MAVICRAVFHLPRAFTLTAWERVKDAQVIRPLDQINQTRSTRLDETTQGKGGGNAGTQTSCVGNMHSETHAQIRYNTHPDQQHFFLINSTSRATHEARCSTETLTEPNRRGLSQG